MKLIWTNKGNTTSLKLFKFIARIYGLIGITLLVIYHITGYLPKELNLIVFLVFGILGASIEQYLLQIEAGD